MSRRPSEYGRGYQQALDDIGDKLWTDGLAAALGWIVDNAQAERTRTAARNFTPTTDERTSNV
jgi:hypothetical protein